jgi:hypothetical protein
MLAVNVVQKPISRLPNNMVWDISVEAIITMADNATSNLTPDDLTALRKRLDGAVRDWAVARQIPVRSATY